MRFGVDIEGQFIRMTGIQHYVDGLLRGLFSLTTEHDIRAFALRLPSRDAIEKTAAARPGTFSWSEMPHARADCGHPWICLPESFSKDHPYLSQRIAEAEIRIRSEFPGGSVDRSAKYDVLHYPQPAGIVRARLKPKQSVATIYDLSTLRFPEAFPEGIVALWDDYYAFVKRRCARVIAISQATRDEIVDRLGIPSDRIDVTPLAPRVSTRHLPDSPERADLLRACGVNGDEPFVLYAGTLEPRKNLSRLVRAFALVLESNPDLPHRLVLAGGSWGDHHREIEEVARHAGLPLDRLLLTGYVSNPQVNALMSACRVFVYVSLYEGFGLPPLEAMVCGAPVIVSNTSSLPEVVGNAGFTVDPLDEAALAGAILRVLSDETENRRRREESFAHAANFCWTTTAELTLRSYEAAAA